MTFTTMTIERTIRRARAWAPLCLCAFWALVVAGCGGSSSSDTGPTPAIQSYAAAAPAVFIGESTQLTAMFSGDTAVIDGIGPVSSGVPVTTPPLARATTFTLTVRSGAQQVQATLTISARYRDRFRTLAPSPVARKEHVSIALADGGALVMGGNTSLFPNTPDSSDSARFDPVTETFLPGPPLAFSADHDHTLPIALEGGGFILAGGGINSGTELGGGIDGQLATQTFDPAAGRFTRSGDLVAHHGASAAAVTLGDGGALVLGEGLLPGMGTIERYDPIARRWAAAGTMTVPRLSHTATRLRDGRVLIVGGFTSDASAMGSAELYDPTTGTSQPTGSLITGRALHAATLLADGRVLVTGGLATGAGLTTSAEIYDPATGRFTAAGAMATDHFGHSAVLLTDGRVLVAGDAQAVPNTEIYDPVSGQWRAGPTLSPAAGFPTVVMLRGGKVLVFGGELAGGAPSAAAFLFE